MHIIPEIMILEPVLLHTYREQFVEHFRNRNLDEAVLAAHNISAGRKAQILTDSEYELIIPFLEKADQKQAGWDCIDERPDPHRT